ncbi:MAG: CmcI family methyltransferase [Candidatus Omnitrophota bacterium]
MLKKIFRSCKRELINLKNLIFRSFYISRSQELDTVGRFHKLYYDAHAFGKTWDSMYWMGVLTNKCPMDMWVYQEIIHEIKPDLIIECGTNRGGSALFLASMCALIAHGEVVSIDIEEKEGRPRHERLQYLRGSSVSEEVLERVRGFVRGKKRVMVMLDSDHRKSHVLAELKAYNGFVTQGSYLIVEDTNINGHPVAPDFGPGPMEAVEEFLKGSKDFIVDKSKEKFYLTFNPGGYLKKIR